MMSLPGCSLEQKYLDLTKPPPLFSLLSEKKKLLQPASPSRAPRTPLQLLCWCLLQQANPPFPVHHVSKHGLATTLLAAHVSCRVYEVVPSLEKGSPHPTKKRKTPFSRVVAAKIKIIPLVLQEGVYTVIKQTINLLINFYFF